MWIGPLFGKRQRPAIVDILAIGEAAGWTEIHLPRKYSLGSGEWTEGDMWLGDRVPNAGNNVYIINQEEDATVNLYSEGEAREVYLTDGNTLNVTFGQLDAYSVEARGMDTELAVDSGALLDTVYVDILQAATFHIFDA